MVKISAYIFIIPYFVKMLNSILRKFCTKIIAIIHTRITNFERNDIMTITKRAFVRTITFSVAAVSALTVFAGLQYSKRVKAAQSLEYSYMRAVEDLSLNLDNIKNNLEKGMYTNSVSMLSSLSNKLCSDAATAKGALSQLPIAELNLEQTYQFLSQVGNYSKALAEKCAEGEQLTNEEKENISALYDYAVNLSGNMWQVEERIRDGEVVFGAVNSLNAEDVITVTDGFKDFENLDNNYPTLIYDGPFSDHILEKDPLMLRGEKEISEEEALRRAVKLTGADNLVRVGDESGKMPSYVFENGRFTVAITKAGGFYSYMLSGRQIDEQKLTASKATEIAEDYLERLGIMNAEDTYYEIQNGVCIINFAAEQGDAILYTDLIKIGVALDNGEVLSFDLRGYITNHTIRDLPAPRISEETAISLVSKSLRPIDADLCVIPSEGMREILCYEVQCVGESGQNVLVYINALTGIEEQILLLKISNNGTLTV